MLDQLSKEYVERNFKLYDQNWLFYKNFLGEPFLIDDILVYFDGDILYVCAFSLIDLSRKINLDNLMPKIEQIIPIEKIKVIDIWGNIDSNSVFFKDEKIIDYTPVSDGMYDCIINVNDFLIEKNRKARLALNAARNKGLTCKIIKRDVLLHTHLKLMKKFLEEHDIGGAGKQIFLSMGEAIKLENAYLVESYNVENMIIGFALLIIPTKSDAIYTLACFDNSTRAADMVMHECISFCKKNNIQRLHLGYSATKGLLDFKIKWGGASDGQTYEEFFLCVNKDDYILKHVNDGTFLWHNRLTIDKDC